MLLNKEIYCNTLYPMYLDLVSKYQSSPYYTGIMNDFIQVNPKTSCLGLTEDQKVAFVPMTNVQEKNNLVLYDIVPYETVKKGFTVFAKGDLIWAKITPCMQNGKSCVVDNMPTSIGFGSTEFHVIRKRSNDIYMPFIWAIFSNDNVLKAAQATFSGSAGQQRVSASFIENFPAAVPNYSTQVLLVDNLEKKLRDKNEKLHQADELLHSFEKEIIHTYGLMQSNNKLCYAIKRCELDGVIDAKRYMFIGDVRHVLTVDGICNIVEQKVNASKLGVEVVDWIRIDDLPNQPIDISGVRTQPANEIEGTFFEVEKGDILVARLGPTILNQKIVMVRKTQRRTIASAEFLVLRCKEGVNPEAVMAILKTGYYRDIMYAHARGSTPSRYRLNREDMLKLAFPDILAKQEYWANKSIEIRKMVKKLRSEAEQDWQQARKQFEKELLGEIDD